jgi:hypothetical protein
LVKWLIFLKTKLLRRNPKLKTFMLHSWWCSTRVTSIMVNFIFILSFFELLCTCNHFKFSSHILHYISWNDNKLVFYAWLRLCGVTIKCPFTFAHGMS